MSYESWVWNENFTVLLTNLTWLFVGLGIQCSNFYQASSYICKNSIKSYNECRFSNLFKIVLTFITQNLVSFTRNLSCPNWRFNQFKRCLSSSEFYYGPNRSHTFTRIFLTVLECVLWNCAFVWDLGYEKEGTFRNNENLTFL